MTKRYDYQIHDVITVSSATPLPELERFMVAELTCEPDIAVDLRTNVPASDYTDYLRYRELFGPFGFACNIGVREDGMVDVRSSAMLRRSPHVLYTNVIEPILRWSVVERGYVLIHGACMAEGVEGLLVTARTDTGKTTTMLRSLDNYDIEFLSDDLTLLRADGTLLCYPKPLTISNHTLRAVSRTNRLTRRERFTLGLQSRVHSRSGRKFAHFLIRTGLPVATINMVMQTLVPPPKYQVDRLVPDVSFQTRAQWRRMVVIERGGAGQRNLEPSEAFDLLMSNTEDAYGFPPYHKIEGFLQKRNGRDLRAAEAEIVRQALQTIESAGAIQSSTYDWWAKLPLKSNGSLVPATGASAPAALA